MAGFSNALEKAVLEWLFKGQSMPANPTALWVSLHTADPEGDGANELTIGAESYARVNLAPDASAAAGNWSAIRAGTGSNAAAQEIANVGAITFPVAGGDGWGAITHFGIWKDQTSTAAADFLFGGEINSGAGATVGVGVQPSFPTDTLIAEQD